MVSIFAIFELLVIVGLLYCVYFLIRKNVNEAKHNKPKDT